MSLTQARNGQHFAQTDNVDGLEFRHDELQ
jgi:hypothetical protein